ncbi:MAG: hypothetical protein GF401_20705 [Chitinivibrionales bacterium]|nr:hypothetical protein [Chitinivibrionales bacterium]
MSKKKAPPMSSPRTIVSVCSNCAVCCTEPIVPVTDSDVHRITKRTGLRANQIVRFYSYSDADYDPEAGLWIRMPYGKRLLGLKKKNERCIFLSPQNLCTIYEFRPLTCRTFPFQEADSESGQKLEINKAVKCRLKIADVKLQEGVMSQIARENSEDERYERKVRKWNRSGGKSFDDYLRFMKRTS